MQSSTACKRPRLRANSGLTMVEVITAFSVAVTGIFGAFQMHMSAMDGLRAQRDEALAQEALANELETLRAMPYADLPLGDDLPFLSDTSTLAPLHLHQPLRTVRETATPGLREVHLRLNWIADTGRKASREVTALVAERGTPNGS